MRRIAVINQKGGVGKTTTAANLGAALARLGQRVLVCDLDPQCNLTVHLDVDPAGETPTLYELLRGEARLDQVVRAARSPGLSLLPSSVDLAGVELELVNVVGREVLLRDAFEADARAHRGARWDIVLCDCPPSLGLLSLNALVLCDEVFVPVQSEFFALQGLSKLLEVTGLVQRRLNPQLRVTGLVSCRHDTSTNLGRQVMDDIRSHFGDVLFRSVIRRNVKLAEAPSHGRTIFEYDPECRGAADYLALAREMLRLPAEEPALPVRRGAAAPLPPPAAPAVPADPPGKRGLPATPGSPATRAPSAAPPVTPAKPAAPATPARPAVPPPPVSTAPPAKPALPRRPAAPARPAASAEQPAPVPALTLPIGAARRVPTRPAPVAPAAPAAAGVKKPVADKAPEATPPAAPSTALQATASKATPRKRPGQADVPPAPAAARPKPGPGPAAASVHGKSRPAPPSAVAALRRAPGTGATAAGAPAAPGAPPANSTPATRRATPAVPASAVPPAASPAAQPPVATRARRRALPRPPETPSQKP